MQARGWPCCCHHLDAAEARGRWCQPHRCTVHHVWHTLDDQRGWPCVHAGSWRVSTGCCPPGWASRAQRTRAFRRSAEGSQVRYNHFRQICRSGHPPIEAAGPGLVDHPDPRPRQPVTGGHGTTTEGIPSTGEEASAQGASSLHIRNPGIDGVSVRAGKHRVRIGV